MMRSTMRKVSRKSVIVIGFMCFSVVAVYNTAKVDKNPEYNMRLTYFNNFLHALHAAGGRISSSEIHGPAV